MNQPADKITKIIECESITTSLQSSSVFSFKKKGYVRLIRDYGRRSYVIEFFPYIKDKAPSTLKPNLAINISKKLLRDEKIQYKHGYKIMIISVGDGVCYIEIKDDSEAKLFQEKMEKCLEDPNLIDDSLIIFEKNEPSIKRPKVANLEAKGETVKVSKDDVLLSLYQPAKVANEQVPEIKSQIVVTNNLKENPVEPSIVAKKFYSNERCKSVQISEEVEVFSEPAKKTLSTPKSNLKRRRDDEDSLSDKTTGKISTPKRNMLNENKKSIRTTPSMNTRAMKRLNIDPENQENQENKIDDFLKSPVKAWNRNNSKTFLKGFSNLGNTCYMNSILQCLLNIDIFSLELVKSYDKIKSIQIKNLSETNKDFDQEQIIQLETEQNFLYNSLCELVKARESHNEDLKVKSLRDVKNTISKEATRFSGYQQHDAHEFLCQILDQLKDEAAKVIKSDDQAKMSNPVVDNFEFQVSHEIMCQNCGNTICNTEEYNNLCLELPESFQNSLDNEKNISIQNALDIFFQSELLSDFKCEKCNTKGDNLIKRKFVRLPRVLILHLKRYQFKEVEESNSNDAFLNEENPTISKIISFQLVKNESSILIPRYLELKHLLTSKIDQLKPPCPVDKDIFESSLKIDDTPRPITPLKSQGSRKSSQKTPNRPALGKISINSSAVRSIKFDENSKKNLFMTPEARSKRPILAMKANSLSKNTKFLDGVYDNDSDEESNKKDNLRTNLSKKFDEDTRQAVKLSLATYKAESLGFIDEKEEDLSDFFEDPFIEEDNQIEEKKFIVESKKTENSYRMIGIVNHLGSSSNSGHYISDVLNLRTKRWSSFDDSHVESLSEDEVFSSRIKTGYIFFYIHNSLINE